MDAGIATQLIAVGATLAGVMLTLAANAHLERRRARDVRELESLRLSSEHARWLRDERVKAYAGFSLAGEEVQQFIRSELPALIGSAEAAGRDAIQARWAELRTELRKAYNQVALFGEECLKPVDLPGGGVPSRIIKNRLSSKAGGPTPAGKVDPVPTVVPDLSAVLPAGEEEASLIDRIVREGARRMLTAALQAEVEAYIERFADERDENGRHLVVRNGTAEPRTVLTSAGAIAVIAPRVNDKRTDPVTGDRMRFSSAILPPWARKTPQVTEVLPLLYLHGLSSGDFVPALSQFPGTSAGLSGPVITRLTEDWKGEARAFMARDLSGVDYVYVWADGIHVNIRLEEARLCLLVMIGVRADGRKELIALSDGYRESTESWADLLRDCARRGMRAPVLAIGDGALGFWGALRDVFPQAKEQRCWFHKIANVLDALPKSAHPGAKKALAEIWNAENKDKARKAIKDFKKAYGAKFPKATAKVTNDEVLLAFYDYPAEHWVHLRTTNPIESTFATVRHRTKVTKGPGSKAAGLAMAYKLIESAQRRWRSVNAPHLVALVRAGATFVDGKLVERPEGQAPGATPSHRLQPRTRSPQPPKT